MILTYKHASKSIPMGTLPAREAGAASGKGREG